ncbi:MAG: isopentenyl-diphosphate Delta-isomerase [Gemmatimonadaceae bacterium]
MSDARRAPAPTIASDAEIQGAEELVILVDPDDNEIGSLPKLRAHRERRLHRAISVFIFDPAGNLLLQRRAAGKYHSAGLWTNTCCSHPRPGERVEAAASRRLREEMSLSCELRHVFAFTYEATLGAGLFEHELDHVFVGQGSAAPAPDPAEVAAWRWIAPDALDRELREQPADFTAWFEIALRELRARGERGPRASVTSR